MTRRGSILLEVLLAIAVFAFAGVVVLGVLQETVAATARADRRAVAMDLARSRLAEIESGGGADADVAPEADAPNAGTSLPDAFAGLRVEERLEPTEHADLELAVIEVWDDTAPEPTALAQAMGSATAEPTRLAVLRQLVRAARSAPRPEFNK